MQPFAVCVLAAMFESASDVVFGTERPIRSARRPQNVEPFLMCEGIRKCCGRAGQVHEAPEVKIEAKGRFCRSTKYHVSIVGVSYGRCKKYWNDFEDLYDSLELRYSTQLESVPFPTYVTRRKNTKSEAVESNRKNLEALLSLLLRHPELSRSEALTEFLQLTDFVAGAQAGDEERDRESERERTLRDRPGPTPATVKRIYHNTALDEADEAEDDVSETTQRALDEATRALDTSHQRGASATCAADGAHATAKTVPPQQLEKQKSTPPRPVPSETANTVWIGR